MDVSLDAILKKLRELNLKWTIDWKMGTDGQESHEDVVLEIKAGHQMEEGYLNVKIGNLLTGSCLAPAPGYNESLMEIVGPLFSLEVSLNDSEAHQISFYYHKLYPEQAIVKYLDKRRRGTGAGFGFTRRSNDWIVRTRNIRGHPDVSENPLEYRAIKDYFDRIIGPEIQSRKDEREAYRRKQKEIAERGKRLFSDR
ncbi:MAG: hypothetical protein ABSH28_08090 [Acidobacteriota bacterium]|jgi:hypothetical protein